MDVKDIVDRLLRGERLYRRQIERDYGYTTAQAQAAIRQARWILLDEHNAFLPIANYHGDFVLEVTTDAVEAYYGEQPQVRDLATRIGNCMRRLGGAVALDKVSPRQARNVLGQIDDSVSHMERSLESVDLFMEIRKESAE